MTRLSTASRQFAPVWVRPGRVIVVVILLAEGLRDPEPAGRLILALIAPVGGIRRRFGLGGDEPEALWQIGATHDRCRERIRQLEVGALQKLRELLSDALTQEELRAALDAPGWRAGLEMPACRAGVSELRQRRLVEVIPAGPRDTRKSNTYRHLDGRTWDQFPEVSR